MPITTIVAAVDLSVQADQALERAAALAELRGAKLVIAYAQADDAPIANVGNEMLRTLGDVTAAVRAEEARRLDERLEALRGRGVAAELVSRTGAPGEVVAQIAAERHAELVVAGTHGLTGISRFLLGSVANAILRHAPCDVLVCRGTSGPTAFQRPLVATDFSPAAARALRNASELTAPGAAIDVVHAWQLPAGSWGATLLGQARFPWSTVRDAVVSAARTQADQLVAGNAALGRTIHVELVQGPPASVITHAAERGGYDLIALGTHGHRGFRRLLLGSVAESTIRHAPCSVLVAHGEHAGETAKFKKA
ncbi:MAG TPA: universal stress protein [Kofleriaceae bacterium]|nr:universal stress protein [Kofleriaceae bacterium]